MTKQFLAGNTAYVTGAGSGIGKEIALLFAKQGARIVAVDLNLDTAQSVAQEIIEQGGNARAAKLDVSDPTATANLADELQESGWLPDIVVNNAGMGYIASFLDTEPEDWRRTLDVNVMGVANGCRVFAQKWRDQGTKGRIVNIASMASVTPTPSLSAYTASKYAVEGLSEVLALELPEIEITCVHPGIINTPIVRNASTIKIPEPQVEKVQRHYVEKGDTPDVVANAILQGLKQNTSNIYAGSRTSAVPMLKRFLPRSWFRSILKNQATQIGYLAE